MARQIALLRGINLASRNRVSMPDLRTALGEAGYEDVATLVQSGNIVLSSSKKPKTLEREITKLVKDEFGVDAATVVRTRDELAGVIERNPIPAGPSIPKLFQVTFFSGEPDAARVAALLEQDFGNEELAVIGREAYAWHPGGIHKSKLARELGKGLRGDGTARNWNTVTKLLELSDDGT
jgi:uncharacterized protein (DUF1697 family)